MIITVNQLNNCEAGKYKNQNKTHTYTWMALWKIPPRPIRSLKILLIWTIVLLVLSESLFVTSYMCSFTSVIPIISRLLTLTLTPLSNAYCMCVSVSIQVCLYVCGYDLVNCNSQPPGRINNGVVNNWVWCWDRFEI